MKRIRPATAPYHNRDSGHIAYMLTKDQPHEKTRRRTVSRSRRCELDADLEPTPLVKIRARDVNRNTKAYKAGYADGVAAAREAGAEFPLSAQAAGKADEALLEAVGIDEMSRILGVKKPLERETPLETTLEFQVACDEYNAAYAAGWDAEELGALKRFAEI
jgi:hypothetical protein